MVNHRDHQRHRSIDELPKLGDLFVVSLFEIQVAGSDLVASKPRRSLHAHSGEELTW